MVLNVASVFPSIHLPQLMSASIDLNSFDFSAVFVFFFCFFFNKMSVTFNIFSNFNKQANIYVCFLFQ